MPELWSQWMVALEYLKNMLLFNERPLLTYKYVSPTGVKTRTVGMLKPRQRAPPSLSFVPSVPACNAWHGPIPGSVRSLHGNDNWYTSKSNGPPRYNGSCNSQMENGCFVKWWSYYYRHLVNWLKMSADWNELLNYSNRRLANFHYPQFIHSCSYMHFYNVFIETGIMF